MRKDASSVLTGEANNGRDRTNFRARLCWTRRPYVLHWPTIFAGRACRNAAQRRRLPTFSHEFDAYYKHLRSWRQACKEEE